MMIIMFFQGVMNNDEQNFDPIYLIGLGEINILLNVKQCQNQITDNIISINQKL